MGRCERCLPARFNRCSGWPLVRRCSRWPQLRWHQAAESRSWQPAVRRATRTARPRRLWSPRCRRTPITRGSGHHPGQLPWPGFGSGVLSGRSHTIETIWISLTPALVDRHDGSRLEIMAIGLPNRAVSNQSLAVGSIPDVLPGILGRSSVPNRPTAAMLRPHRNVSRYAMKFYLSRRAPPPLAWASIGRATRVAQSSCPNRPRCPAHTPAFVPLPPALLDPRSRPHQRATARHAHVEGSWGCAPTDRAIPTITPWQSPGRERRHVPLSDIQAEWLAGRARAARYAVRRLARAARD